MFKLYDTLVHTRESICTNLEDELVIYINEIPFKKYNNKIMLLPFVDTFGFDCKYYIKLSKACEFKRMRHYINNEL